MLFLTIFSILTVHIHPAIIVISGEPYDWNWCYQIDSTNWTYCIDECNHDDECIVAYLNLTLGVCYQCQVGQINSINGSSSEQIGFKAQVTECTSLLLSEYFTSLYVIKYNSLTDIWTIEYIDSKSCDDGWTLSNRQDVQWCLKIITGVINGYQGGLSTCDEQNATLSAIGSDFEHQFLQRKVYDYFSGGTLKAILTDGYMKDECITAFENSQFTTTCNFPDGFTWNDMFVSNYSFYNWQTGNPDCYNGIQLCIVQYSMKSGVYDGTLIDGREDTVPCATDSAATHASYATDFTYGTTGNEFNAVFCGKLAT